MASRRSIFFPSLALVALAGACGGGPTAPEGGGDGGFDPPQREILASPSFATNVNEIFVRRGCASGACHGATGGRAGLELTSSAAANYAALVNVDATTNSGFKRVLPGDAVNSYLVIKLEGRQAAGEGGQMPLNGSPLDDIDMGNVKNWINNGAPNN